MMGGGVLPWMERCDRVKREATERQDMARRREGKESRRREEAERQAEKEKNKEEEERWRREASRPSASKFLKNETRSWRQFSRDFEEAWPLWPRR
ncbi:hypothetical protein ASPZODRAFT_128974 [Penicilliopsis zonata CBS 506.65]|uniref:Uncharacterized protein n=1 Tax=Penicilliopsis zonata CBS 506.65 TaxID=1073090 RepID=A0A1L9STF3_9EURO|nr:hypothetical protein ASPZODRAFT_128974 [Penicilliopsis zonata CBS 506.65]OJJ50357.1 hypothetical protein ASPZODRAFT_128974 [Penicilliopsis zonata CBS 506.65]